MKTIKINRIYTRSFILFLACFYSLFVFLFTNVQINFAQDQSFGFSSRVIVKGDTILDGYIVASNEDGFSTTTEAYQDNIIGVITENPAVELNLGNTENTYPIATSGEAYVWVSLANGSIKNGDPITSSPWEGIGMKATAVGPILGMALEDVKASEDNTENEKTVTKIRVSVNPTSANQGALSGGGIAGSLKTGPQSLLSYIVSGIILLATISISLFYFGRLSMKGVEAMGRNTLAYKRIQFGILANLLAGLLIATVGIGAALYIMR